MKTVCAQDQCTGCMACLESCSEKAIEVFDSLRSYNAVIDESRCHHCGLCHRVCPNQRPVTRQMPMVWYEGWATDDIRAQSSSGGAAAAIIKSFIEQGGYAASCLFERGQFCFDVTNDIKRAERFSGSKYIKSNPRAVYSPIRSLLRQGERVLFLGLPCQVAGLKNFLNAKEAQKLYTIDLVCHGTPSPQILRKFLAENGVDIDQLQDIRFRKKASFDVSVAHSNEGFADVFPAGVQDMYTYAFLNALDYTENCYNCTYASLERVSDVTLGDSWSSELERAQRKKGISLILCQTEKGREMVEAAGLILHDVDFGKAVEANHQLRRPSLRHPGRNRFLKNMTRGFHYAFAKSVPDVYVKKRIKALLIRTKVIRGGTSLIEYAVQYKTALNCKNKLNIDHWIE